MPKAGCPDALWLPVEAGVVLEESRVTVRWATAQDWHTLARTVYPDLLTLDLDVLTHAFKTCFFKNPKSNDLIAKQDIWRVDIKHEMTKPLAGVFAPIVRAMERENKRRLDALDRVRLLEGYAAPNKSLAENWVRVRVTDALADAYLGETIAAPAPTLEWFTYYRGLFGPNRVSAQDLWVDLFTKGVHLEGRQGSFAFLVSLDAGGDARHMYSQFERI
ncbi:MAG: hypothetical protein C0514_00615 [Candidatus Puniceispirillum sp.]|nr:hypothetical protein [Candidatus Puniceispirillum sp.]